MTESLMERDKNVARKKGLYAAGAAVGTTALLATGWWVVGLAGVVGTGYLAWDWFRYRARRGMRF
jgi:hypothetical protein